MWFVSTGHNCPEFCFPGANSRCYCERLQTGCLHEHVPSVPQTEASLGSSALVTTGVFLMVRGVLPGVELAAENRERAIGFITLSCSAG